MLKKITNNLGLKIISAFFAVILWLVVVNINDPTIIKAYNNIKVTPVNVEIITNQGKVFKVLDNTDNINISVQAKRSVLDKLRNSDFQAVADMEDINEAEQFVPIKVSAKKSNSEIQIRQDTYNMKISVENSATKQFAINAKTTGNPSEGYAVGNISVQPNVLKVTGAESVVNKIKKVVVEIDVSDMSSNINIPVTPKLYDEEGNIIESDLLIYDNNEFNGVAEILETKSLSLDFSNIVGESAEGYRYTGLEYEPKTIMVKGTANELQNLESIPLNGEELNLNIDGATGNIEKAINISEYLPQGVQLVDEDAASIAVTLKIEKLATKTFDFPLKNIKIQNLANRFDLEYTSNESVGINIQGLQRDLDSLKVSSIKGTINLNGKKAGNHIVPLEIVLPDGFSLVGDVTVTVKLTEAQEAMTDEEESDDSGTSRNNQDRTTEEQEDTTNDTDNDDFDNSTENNENSNNIDSNNTDSNRAD